ncbi:hypothetical protein GGR53DRAFT_463326 [Hypoxylon sp. FL1150]|nr:hypothetical protein GGR53DRAFT_463326 [Hypoxylon sp. FL1150]
MFFSNGFMGKLYLLLLYWDSVTAVPVIEPSDRIDIMKREPGDTSGNPIEVTFKTDEWMDTAEEDCYVMLCERSLQLLRVLETPLKVLQTSTGDRAAKDFTLFMTTSYRGAAQPE